MPPRPFPLPFSIGTDIVHVKRIHDILLRAERNPPHCERFLRRFLTPGEVHEFQARFGDVSGSHGKRLSLISQHLAGRWAAKEAAIKAVTWRRLSFHDVIVRRIEGEGRLYAVILDETSIAQTAEASGISDGVTAHVNDRSTRTQSSRNGLPMDADGQIARISISHDGEYATAVCLAAEGRS